MMKNSKMTKSQKCQTCKLREFSVTYYANKKLYESKKSVKLCSSCFLKVKKEESENADSFKSK